MPRGQPKVTPFTTMSRMYSANLKVFGGNNGVEEGGDVLELHLYADRGRGEFWQIHEGSDKAGCKVAHR